MSNFAEQLANLSNPAPVFNDPEIEDDESAAKVASSAKVGGDSDSDVDDTRGGRGVSSSLRKSNVPLLSDLDKSYKGHKVSRSALVYDESASEEGGSDDDDDDVEQESDDDDDVDVSASEMEDEDQEEDDDDDMSEDDGESEEAEEEMKPFSAKDQSLERQRGTSVGVQLSLWDTILQGRIKMQPVLTLVNQMPFHNKFSECCDEDDEEVQSAVQSGRQKMSDLMEIIMNLQTTLLAQNSDTFHIVKEQVVGNKPPASKDEDEITSSEDEEDDEEEEAAASSKRVVLKKRKLSEDDYPDLISKRYKTFENYRNQTIQKWYEKTRISSGKLSKNFSSFEQSALKQIEQILSDKMRLIKRSQLKRFSNAIIGEDTVTDQSSRDKEYYTEIYNDDDFYHQLLRSYIESKTSNANDVSAFSKQWLEIQNLRSKLKKKVDTRSSKGRKIRHDIHRKLINFMAPRDTSKWSNEARNDLYRSLFGQAALIAQQ